MGNTKITPIIHLMGPEGSGKTTLCRLLLEAFTDKTVLAVDTSPDDFLSLSCGIHSPMTVATLLQQIHSTPMTHEALDWALQDLPITVASESDAEILPWGAMPESLSDVQQDLLSYGLPRLFQTYDIVIWEGNFGIIEPLLKGSSVQPLIVITPEDENYCQSLSIESGMVLLSKAQAIDLLPATAAFQVYKGNWKFVGKLPPLSPSEKRIKELPHYFQDCFHKLDLPFELGPRGL
jgi:uridine kinase